ncbi:hypothetical protein SUGI_1069560, partial [Cryptomeria japonica]
MGRRKRLLDE